MNALNANIDGRLSLEFGDCKHIVKTDVNVTSLYTWCAPHMHEFTIILIRTICILSAQQLHLV